MKFLDLRRYFFANIVSITLYIRFGLEYKYFHTDFPPPIHTAMWGEPATIVSPEEGHFRVLLLVSFGFLLLFLALFLIEFVIRLLLDIFVFKNKVSNKRFKIPKFLVVIYSIWFYTGFLLFFYPFFLYFFG